MPRQRSPDRIEAEKLYLESNGKLKLIDIAEKLKRPEGTIRGWKNKDKWDSKLNGTFQKDNKKNTERSKTKKRKKGAQPNNKNAVGHGPPAGNKNAEKHGFFSKYLPEDTLDIINEIEERSPIDIQWDMIMIQYSAIIRSQRIMHVESKNEMIKELKKSKFDVIPKEDGFDQVPTEVEYEFQFAWDRQATLLKAQSRAMGELRSSIKRYEEMLQSDLATEKQKLRIQKLKAEIDKVKDNNDDKPIEIVIKRKGEDK